MFLLPNGRQKWVLIQGCKGEPVLWECPWACWCSSPHIPGVPRRACAMVSFSWGARHWQLVSSANGAGAVRVWKGGGKHKVILFFHRMVKKEPFNCVVTRLNDGLFHGDFYFLVTLLHIQFIQYEIWRQYGFLNTTQFIACLEKLKQCELRAGTYLLCLQDKVRSDGYLSKQLNPCFGLNKSKGPRCKMYPPMWKSQLEKLIRI